MSQRIYLIFCLNSLARVYGCSFRGLTKGLKLCCFSQYPFYPEKTPVSLPSCGKAGCPGSLFSYLSLSLFMSLFLSLLCKHTHTRCHSLTIPGKTTNLPRKLLEKVCEMGHKLDLTPLSPYSLHTTIQRDKCFKNFAFPKKITSFFDFWLIAFTFFLAVIANLVQLHWNM